MANDPAFLFYPGDYLRDTQVLSERVQVAYDRIMCEHMRHICITQAQLNFLTKRLKPDEKEELMMVISKVQGGFQIGWVAESIAKRREYSDSRRKNREGKANKTSTSYVSHMENVNEIAIEDRIKEALNEILLENLRPLYNHLDFEKELEGFKAKVIGASDHYRQHTSDGLRLAFSAQLRNGKHKPKEKAGSEFDEKEVLKRTKQQKPKTNGIGSATSPPGSLE